MDDLYKNMKIYDAKIMRPSSTNQNTQNVAFVSSNITSSTNEAIKTAHGVSAANSKNNASTLPNVDSLSDDVIYSFFARDRLEVGDGNADNKSKEISQEDMKESRAPKNQDSRYRETTKRTMLVEETTSNALVSQCDGFGYDWSDQAEEGPTNFALMAYTSSSSSSSDTEVSTCSKACLKSYEKEKDDLKLTLEKFENSSKNLSKLLDSQICDKFKSGVGYDSQVFDSQVFDSQVNDRYKTGKGYHAVPPPYTGNFMPPKPDLVLADKDEYVFSESATSVPSAATSEVKTSVSKPKSVSEPLIEDWISDSENENETESKSGQRKPSNAKVEFVKSYEHVKSPRESVKKVENNKQAKYPRKNSQSPRGNKRNWNNLMTQKLGSNFEFKNKACYVCGSFNHLIKDCDFYEKKMVEKPVWNNARRVNHQNSQRITHPHPKRNFVPRAVLMKSGFKTLNTARQSSSRAAVSVNTARPINTAYTRLPKPYNSARTASNVFNRAHSHEPKAVVSDKKGDEANVVKEKGVIDNGCSRYMTRSKSYLSDYEEFNSGLLPWRKSQRSRISGTMLGWMLGYNKEERIYYDEVFAPVARIEAIRLFLAYASFKDFVVYQIEVKSAFLYGKIEEEVYVCQPLVLEDPEFPNKVYKVEKALYGLHQAPKAWHETLSTYLLEHGF
ncbi:ribonuclease H-like domain-containing protein [Tanacetum coccineum]